MPYTEEEILQTMRNVGRIHFLPDALKAFADADQALPIACNQTISQPYVVAYMTNQLLLEKEFSVLEIGTGSGFQTAILSRLVRKVFSIEIIPQLATEAKSRLLNLGYSNIRFKTGDGYFGWDKYAPFNAIIVTACAELVPPSLLAQLRNGGRMIIPIGKTDGHQQLQLISKSISGSIQVQALLPVRFVPFRRL